MRTRVFLDEAKQQYYKIADSYIVKSVNQWANQPVIPYFEMRRCMAMVDVVTENFKSRRNSGEIINNPMWKVTHQRYEKPSNAHGTGPGGSTCTYWELNCLPAAGTVYDAYTGPQEVVDSICNQYSSESIIAQTSAWANIDVSEMQAWASLGELPETIEMIVDLLKKAAKLTIAAKRGDVKTLLKEVKKFREFDTFADAWLLWRYGVRPLVGEITSLLKILEARPIVGKRQTFRGKYVLDEVVGQSTHHVNWSSGGAGWDFKTTEKRSAVFKAGVLVQIESSINSGLAMLGLDNPLEAVWELIPFSFIIDWFFNVGDIIAAAVGNPSLSPVLSFVTETVTHSTIVNTTGWSLNGDTTACQTFAFNAGTTTMVPGYVNTFTTATRRVPLAERYSLPRLNMSLSLAKLTDLALIARAITK